MYISDFSRSVGVGKATTRKTRGLTRSTMRLMVPPLPAASRPSKTMITRNPSCTTRRCNFTSSTCSFSSSRSNSLFFILPDCSSWFLSLFLDIIFHLSHEIFYSSVIGLHVTHYQLYAILSTEDIRNNH